jgi:putative copper resistance protein D
LLTSGKLGAALGASETGRAWVAVTVFATVLAITSRLTVRWEWHVPLLIPALLGVVAVPVTGNAGQGPDHDYTTSAVIVFAVAVTVWAGTTIVNAALPHHPGGDRRAGLTAVAAASVALLYGLLLLGLRAGTSGLASRYGLLGIIVGAALAVGFAAGLVGLRRARGIPALAVAGVAMGALAALSLMAIQTAPRLLASPPSIWDVLLGYQLPGAPTPMRLATFWRFDPFLGALGLALAGAYLFGVMRLRRRGDAWPVGRTVAWLTGCAFLVIATGSGVRSYGSAMFSVHMAEHMMLNMFVPVLLVLGAPVTLALRVLPSAAPGTPPGPREWIVRAVHSPFTAFLSSPATAFVLFVGSLYVVYFTPLFDTLVRYHWGHEFMSVHFLITGYLFYWGIIGVDPGPRRLPFIGRLALLFAIMPFHAFFGVAMMSMTTAVGGNFYRGLALPWVPNLNDDQHLGGAIAWGASEVPVIIVVIALITQWARQDRRTSVRSDRHADAGYDDDLDAYNNMLRELARQRTSK